MRVESAVHVAYVVWVGRGRHRACALFCEAAQRAPTGAGPDSKICFCAWEVSDFVYILCGREDRREDRGMRGHTLLLSTASFLSGAFALEFAPSACPLAWKILTATLLVLLAIAVVDDVGASLFAINATAWVGWTAVLFMACATPASSRPMLYTIVRVLEMWCCYEVWQIGVGRRRGDLALGIGVHYTRLLLLFGALPGTDLEESTAAAWILVAWGLTESARYAFFAFSGSRLARTLRYACPLITLPLGALAEACVFWMARSQKNAPLRWAVTFAVLTNAVGGAFAYAKITKRGVHALTGSV